MIYYGVDVLRCLAAVVILLVVADLIVDVATCVLERKKAKLEKELEELQRAGDSEG